MAKVEIDTAGVTIRIDDPNAEGDAIDERAFKLYERVTGVDTRLPTGPAGGVQIERRATSNLGFGTWQHEATPPEAAQDGSGR